MARFKGNVGYIAEQVESAPGVWEDQIVEFTYSGDVIRDNSKPVPGDGLNKDVVVNNNISILCNKYAIEHYHDIRYVVWEGVRWAVTNVEVQRPRLILSLGSVYNGPVPIPEEEP
jgi:hypothetical protein